MVVVADDILIYGEGDSQEEQGIIMTRLYCKYCGGLESAT